MSGETMKETVREKYGQAALRVVAGERSGCCGAGPSGGGCDPITSNLYDTSETAHLPEDAVLASVSRTGRCVVVQEAPRTCGFASEVAALLAERAILDLQGPVLRVTGYDVPYPYWQLEDSYMPSVARVTDAVRRVLAF